MLHMYAQCTDADWIGHKNMSCPQNVGRKSKETPIICDWKFAEVQSHVTNLSNFNKNIVHVECTFQLSLNQIPTFQQPFQSAHAALRRNSIYYLTICLPRLYPTLTMTLSLQFSTSSRAKSRSAGELNHSMTFELPRRSAQGGEGCVFPLRGSGEE